MARDLRRLRLLMIIGGRLVLWQGTGQQNSVDRRAGSPDHEPWLTVPTKREPTYYPHQYKPKGARDSHYLVPEARADSHNPVPEKPQESSFLELRAALQLTCAINAGPVESRHLGNPRNGADIQIKGKTRLGAD